MGDKLTIEDGVLIHCCTTARGRIAIPADVHKVEEYAFELCAHITEIWFEGEIKEIGKCAFAGCKQLKAINFPSVSRIGYRMFEGCIALKEFTIPSSVTCVGARAFLGCENLEELTIPESTVKIGDSAFERCLKLKSLSFPNALRELSYKVCCLCESLEDVRYTPGIKISPDAFESCPLDPKDQASALPSVNHG